MPLVQKAQAAIPSDSTAADDTTLMENTEIKELRVNSSIKSIKDCRHFTAALNVSQIRRQFKHGGVHICQTCDDENGKKKAKLKSMKLLTDINKVKFNGICVSCGFVGCLSQNHCLDHVHQNSKHFCYFNMESNEIWCSKCECVVQTNNQRAKQSIQYVIQSFEEIVVGKSGRMLHAVKAHDDKASPEPSPSTSDETEVLETTRKKKDRLKWKTKNKEEAPVDMTVIPGLANLGNTCYFNSTIQSLKCVFFPLLQVEQPVGGGGITKTLKAFIMDEVNQIRQTKAKRVYNPAELLNAVREKCRQFRNRAQQDAYELFLSLVWAMEDEHSKPAPSHQSKANSTDMQQIFLKGDNETLSIMVPAESTEEEIQLLVAKKLNLSVDELVLTGGQKQSAGNVHESFICKNLLGCLVNMVTCYTCKSVTKAYDDCISISVSIPNTIESPRDLNECTIQDCLDAFTSSTVLSEANGSGYNCEQCNKNTSSQQLQTASVHMQLHGLPKVLVIHLKRLTKAKKISRHVSFDTVLDMERYVDQSEYGPHVPTRYNLQAVIVHSGNRYGGHYVAYVKHSNDWFYTSDTSVQRVQEAAVLEAEAYMFFYTRLTQAENEL